VDGRQATAPLSRRLRKAGSTGFLGKAFFHSAMLRRSQPDDAPVMLLIPALSRRSRPATNARTEPAPHPARWRSSAPIDQREDNLEMTISLFELARVLLQIGIGIATTQVGYHFTGFVQDGWRKRRAK
jgi:hypothetical protein